MRAGVIFLVLLVIEVGVFIPLRGLVILSVPAWFPSLTPAPDLCVFERRVALTNGTA